MAGPALGLIRRGASPAPVERNGLSHPEGGADWTRVADLLGPLKAPPDQLKKFPLEHGSDEEPWDVLLSMLAMDEHSALVALAERTGLRFVPEPRLHESSARFYELIPAEIARRHHIAGDLGGDELVEAGRGLVQ